MVLLSRNCSRKSRKSGKKRNGSMPRPHRKKEWSSCENSKRNAKKKPHVSKLTLRLEEKKLRKNTKRKLRNEQSKKRWIISVAEMRLVWLLISKKNQQEIHWDADGYDVKNAEKSNWKTNFQSMEAKTTSILEHVIHV